MKLKEKHRPAPCKVVFSKEGQHQFGGESFHAGAMPVGSKVGMHLLMALDTTDPHFPLEAEEGVVPSRLPIYYPLRFGMGGGEAQYEVIDDRNIRIIYISGEGEADDEEYPYMERFPKLALSLVPFTYEQYRASIMAESGSGMQLQLSPEDWRIVKEEVDPWHLIQFGGSIHPIQGNIIWQCKNEGCKWKEMDARVDAFCRVGATPTDDIQIFGEYGTDVEIYFGLCRMCGTIVTVNRCT